MNIGARKISCMIRVVSLEICGRIFLEKIALLLQNNSAEKFRTFLADNFIKHLKNVQFLSFYFSRKHYNNNPGVNGDNHKFATCKMSYVRSLEQSPNFETFFHC